MALPPRQEPPAQGRGKPRPEAAPLPPAQPQHRVPYTSCVRPSPPGPGLRSPGVALATGPCSQLSGSRGWVGSRAVSCGVDSAREHCASSPALWSAPSLAQHPGSTSHAPAPAPGIHVLHPSPDPTLTWGPRKRRALAGLRGSGIEFAKSSQKYSVLYFNLKTKAQTLPAGSTPQACRQRRWMEPGTVRWGHSRMDTHKAGPARRPARPRLSQGHRPGCHSSCWRRLCLSLGSAGTERGDIPGDRWWWLHSHEG